MNQTLTTCHEDACPTGEPVGDDPDPATGHGLIVTLQVNVDTPDAPDAPDSPINPWLREQFMRIAERAGVTDGRVNLVIVGDAEMTGLHQTYRNEPGTTDVLTFDLRDDTTEPATTSVEADLVLCFDEASRQAMRRGHDTRLELLLYAVHGLLHLLGEDDHSPQAYQRMHEREDKLLTEAGLGPVFGSGPD